MTIHRFYLGYEECDLEVVCDVDYGSDYRDGDFELSIEEIYPDISRKKEDGRDIIAEYTDDDIDKITKLVTEHPDFYEKAAEDIYEADCDRGDWEYEQMKDRRYR